MKVILLEDVKSVGKKGGGTARAHELEFFALFLLRRERNAGRECTKGGGVGIEDDGRGGGVAASA